MTQPRSSEPLIDPRATRFSAWVTTTVLIAVLVTGSAVLLLVQAVVFAIGAFAGPRLHPYGQLYRAFVVPRLGPPTEWEHPAPLRFAQGVGLAFALIGIIGYAIGATTAAVIVICLALAAALLNAAFGLCLGCKIYPRLPLRVRHMMGVHPDQDGVTPR